MIRLKANPSTSGRATRHVLGVGAALMAMLGVVEVTLGIVAEVLIRMHYDVRDKAPYRIHSVRNLETDEEVVARASLREV